MISASARRLGIFKAVADLGGFNVAAEHLGIAQPSVGAHIKALEKQAGQSLFNRGRGTRASLTRAGETLYTYAVEMLRQSEQARVSMTGLGAVGASEVVIAAQRALSNYFLPAHLAAFAPLNPGIRIVTRTGTSENVLDMVRAFEQASGQPVPYQVAPRRAGDIAACYADPALALALLGWRAERDLAAMCTDAWRWQSSNPNGYAVQNTAACAANPQGIRVGAGLSSGDVGRAAKRGPREGSR